MQHAIADFMREAPGYPEEICTLYQARRDRFARLLEGTRFRLLPAAGTYFQLADYTGISELTDTDFCKELTRQHGVAAIPLSPFYARPPGTRLVRFCFAKADATLTRAAERLRSV